MNPQVDKYLLDGCMRCAYGGTPRCKVNEWRETLEALRAVVLSSGLEEELKWGVPCYTHAGANIAIVSAFREYSSLSFFKGVLMKDPAGLLEKQGENSQSGRLIKFTDPAQVAERAALIGDYLAEAVRVEESGEKVPFKKRPEPIPEELLEAFEKDPALSQAFYGLTPGRQRSYIIHVSQAKQRATRLSRIAKCSPMIMAGLGFHDKYKGKGK